MVGEARPDGARSDEGKPSSGPLARPATGDARTPDSSVGRKTIAQKLRLAKGLTLRQWADLIIATVALFKARIIFARLSAKRLIARLQAGQDRAALDKPLPDAKTLDPETAAWLARLDWSIATAANTLPWRTDCLIRCLAADTLLRKQGLAPEFFIGVSKTPDDTLAAHAWLYCQGIPIAGGDGTGFEVLISPDQG